MARFRFPRFIPKGSTKVSEKSGLAVVYVYTSSKDRPAAVAYVGKSAKSTWHFSFLSAAAREQKIADLFKACRDHEARKIDRRKESSQPHTIKVGTIITNSWGYDQTNVDWYVVVGVTPNFVSLRSIAATHDPEGSCGPMSGHCTVAVDTSDSNPEKWGVSFTSDKVTRHKVSGNYVNMKHGCGSVWDGRKLYESWYA